MIHFIYWGILRLWADLKGWLLFRDSDSNQQRDEHACCVVPPHWGCVLWLWHLNRYVREDTGCAEDNLLPTLRSSVVPHRAGGAATGHLGLGGPEGAVAWQSLLVGKREKSTRKKKTDYKTIDCLINEGRGVSFNAVDSGPHSWDQPVTTIMDSRCPGSVPEGQEKRPVLQPAYTPSRLHHHSLGEAVLGKLSEGCGTSVCPLLASPDVRSIYNIQISALQGSLWELLCGSPGWVITTQNCRTSALCH